MNIPNALTIFRIVLIPFFIVAYFTAPPEYFYIPALILVVSGLTDVADGFIARKFHMVTPLGRFLDPVADKLTMASVILSLAVRRPFLWVLLAVYVVKELTLALIGLFCLKSWRNSITAKWYGKATTACLYLLMFVLLLFPEPSFWIVAGLMALAVVFMILSFIFYLKEIKKRQKTL